MQKQEWINSFWWSATCGQEMGKCGVFIPSHSHQAIPIRISIPMKLKFQHHLPGEGGVRSYQCSNHGCAPTNSWRRYTSCLRRNSTKEHCTCNSNSRPTIAADTDINLVCVEKTLSQNKCKSSLECWTKPRKSTSVMTRCIGPTTIQTIQTTTENISV